VNHEAPPGSPQGPEGLRETISWLRDLWGPMRFEVEDEICEGDKVVARVTMHGRHVGELLEDGEVIEHWSVRDDLGQALQLGLLD
jgi:predicted ester cyclase